MKRAGKRPFPRRAVALVAAAATLWAVGRTADVSAAVQSLSGGGALAEQLLRLELEDAAGDDGLNGWTRLLALETPALAEVHDLAGDTASEEPETGGDAAQTAAAPAEEDSVSTGGDGSEAAVPESDTDAIPEEETPETASDASASVPLDLSSIKASQIDVDNHTDGIQVKVRDYLNRTPALTLRSAEEGPQILLVHTHATEAYTMDGDDVYEESDPARTTDANYNMIRVGEEMKGVFEELGLSVVHDTTTYDYPGYSGSYGRSLAGIQSYLDQYPTIQVVLDVHRDALIDSDGAAYAKTTTIDGERVAQVMLVVGTDDGGLTHPDWEDNFTLAVRLQSAMLALDDTLPRPIDLRSQRFNQHLTAGSLLVEVGTSGNTLQEALAGARRFAQAAGQVYLDLVEE